MICSSASAIHDYATKNEGAKVIYVIWKLRLSLAGMDERVDPDDSRSPSIAVTPHASTLMFHMSRVGSKSRFGCARGETKLTFKLESSRLFVNYDIRGFLFDICALIEQCSGIYYTFQSNTSQQIVLRYGE